MAIEYAARAAAHFQYDGTNGASVRDAFAEYNTGTNTLVSDDGDTAVITHYIEGVGTETFTLAAGDRLGLVAHEVVSPAEWAAQFAKVTS